MKRKTAVITGASRGIGRAIAVKYAQEGYELYLTCLQSEEELISFCHELTEQYHIICHHYMGDLSDAKKAGELFESINHVDVLVNNAGISYIGLLADMSIESWHKILDTNLSSVFYLSRLAIPLMIKQGYGKIINISSVWGNVGASCEVAYSASKGGINAFTKALAKELAPSGIQVNAIACGCINTSMNHHLSDDDIQQLCEEIPANRLGQPDEVADLVFKINTAPDYLTGQIITLDGGWT